MSKVIYTVSNPRSQALGIGAIGVLDANSQKSFTVDEDSADELSITAAIASGLVNLVSVGPLQSVYGPQSLTSAQSLSLTGLLAGRASLSSPLILAKSQAVVTRNSGNAGGDSAFTTAYSFILPGGTMGPNGSLFVELETQTTGGTIATGIQPYIGATAIGVEVGWTAVTYDNRLFSWMNNTTAATNKYRNGTTRQGNSVAAFVATTIDTSVDQQVDVKWHWGSASVAAHSMVLHSIRAFVEYGA